MQAAAGETWVLVDLGILAAMLIWLITYTVYIQTLVTLHPRNTYEVYDSLGGAQARLLLPKKQDPATSDSKPARRKSLTPCHIIIPDMDPTGFLLESVTAQTHRVDPA